MFFGCNYTNALTHLVLHKYKDKTGHQLTKARLQRQTEKLERQVEQQKVGLFQQGYI